MIITRIHLTNRAGDRFATVTRLPVSSAVVLGFVRHPPGPPRSEPVSRALKAAQTRPCSAAAVAIY